jgi:hypothetical protein
MTVSAITYDEGMSRWEPDASERLRSAAFFDISGTVRDPGAPGLSELIAEALAQLRLLAAPAMGRPVAAPG